MAYTAITGSYSSTWYPSGSDVARKVKARIYYQITETAQQYKIQYYLQETLYKDNVGVTIDGKLYNAGSQIGSTGSKEYTYKSSNSNHTEVFYTIVSTQTVTINKTWSTQSRTISGKVYRHGYESSIYSTVSKTFTIPALVGYNITYNANGGTGAPADAKKIKTVSTNISATQPVRTGYTFVCWNTAADGSGENYSPSQSYSIDADLALYAIWSPNTYTIVYNANNASATGSTASSTHTYDSPQNLTTNGYSVVDYLFAGWATQSDGGVVYTDGQSVTNLSTSATVTLYAVWKYMFESPDIQELTAYRWNVTDAVADDAGNAGKIIARVVPSYKYSSLTSKSYTQTRVQLFYRERGASSYSQLSNEESIYTITNVEWTTPANTFDIAKQYDILVAAWVWEDDAEKIRTDSTTFISIAEFILDFDGAGESIGIFHTADGKVSGENAVGIEGTIFLYLDENLASGTDYDILTALDVLGWLDNGELV